LSDSAAAPPALQRIASTPRVLSLLALWLLATIGLRPLLVPDEGRYASVAREMLLSGDWLVPRLDGLPFFHKPPLLYWLDAAAMQAFGANQFAARVAPALGALAMGAALYLALRRWHGRRVALTALGVLATAPMFFVGGQYANHDMLVAGCIAVAVFGFAAASASGSRREWQIGWIGCALALLSKGLIGIVLPLAVVGPWLLARRQWRAVAQGLHPWSWLPALALAAPWFVAMQLRFPAFFDYFVIEQHFRRFTQSSFNNAQPFWFFFAVLPLLTLPWSLAAPRALTRAWRERGSVAGPWLGLYGWWALVIVLFFSLPNSKLVGYVLPALAPWCALLACGLAPLARGWRVGMAVAALLSLSVVGALALRSPHSGKPAALALAAQRAPGEPVVFVEDMFYDLPFYAGLTEPVLAASDWRDPAIARTDNWRKELADAARFDPVAAQRVLYPLERLAALPCRPGVNVWFVSTARYRGAALDAVPGLETVYADRQLKLQRAPGRDCTH
jgi:4-amino-4-deoxy-L-arabinose transferase-like glycosyltransferase